MKNEPPTEVGGILLPQLLPYRPGGMDMRATGRDLVTAMVMGLLVPGILLNLGVAVLDGAAETTQPTVQTEPDRVCLSVDVRIGEQLCRMDLDEYLVGVVLAEMPVTFETEALKAQAVAARTYARKATVTGGKHEDGSLCDSPGCCQAYMTEEEFLSRGGTREGLEKVRTAVTQTSGLVLTYAGELIEATYFSCSGGSTEAAVAVWGTDYPYLQAVDSPGEEKAAHDRDTVTFSLEQFQSALGIVLTEEPESWFREVTYTAGGGVDTMVIGGTTYTGKQLRSLLGLRSTALSIRVQGDTVTVTTRGYGHRVGMSQYGADAMAVTGSDFCQILTHYYPGTEITRLESEGTDATG